MATWNPFPYDCAPYRYDGPALRRNWERLHAGDAEPLPNRADVLAAWALFHAGDFEQARAAGLAAGAAGLTVAHKAQLAYATYLEASERRKLALFTDLIDRAAAHAAAQPADANAHYLLACALGRHGQGLSVAKARALGYASRVKQALETAIRLQPRHADAHMALGCFHAEVVDRVGKLVARAQGADAATGLRMFRRALELNPRSAMAMVEYASGLLMLEGDKRLHDADRLYAEAAACEPVDATERLCVEIAKAELAD